MNFSHVPKTESRSICLRLLWSYRWYFFFFSVLFIFFPDLVLSMFVSVPSPSRVPLADPGQTHIRQTNNGQFAFLFNCVVLVYGILHSRKLRASLLSARICHRHSYILVMFFFIGERGD